MKRIIIDVKGELYPLAVRNIDRITPNLVHAVINKDSYSINDLLLRVREGVLYAVNKLSHGYLVSVDTCKVKEIKDC